MASTGRVVFESNWYSHPIEIQKYVILIIARSQQPTYFTGIGVLDCTLETFGKVEFISFETKINCAMH